MAASPAGTGPEPGRLASFLPGPVPDRETWEGWTRWRLTRGDFTPAPVVTAAQHAGMTARQRRLHDLHRAATHSNLAIQETPMSAWVSREMRSLVEINAFCRGPDTRPGLMVNGGGCQGKTETICEALACFEDEWLDLHDLAPGAIEGTLDHHVPVAYVRTPVKATPISACQRILDFYGEDHKGMRMEDLLRTVKQAVHDHGTKALAIDDITRLKLHREADQDVLDLIRELMSLPLTLILIGVGIPKSGLLRDGRRDPRTGQWIFPPVKDRGKSRNDDAPGQTDLRFELVDLDRFSYGGTASTAAWITHLVGLEQQLRLLHARDGMLSDGDMPEYLFRRTGGIVGVLRKLIQKACRHAIGSGAEEITTCLLDSLTLTRKDMPGLDPDSGEIPDIPAAPAPAAEKPGKIRKPRNTGFDDRGVPSAGTAG
jgi:AAA domain